MKNFYLNTPLDHYEYVWVRLSDIPEEFVNKYNLQAFVKDGWVYFKIQRGVYGLPQAGKLANDLLTEHLNAAGYYQAVMTPGLWCHKWWSIMFCLIVDDFGIEYVGEQHIQHLSGVLKVHYDITEDWEGSKFAGIDLEWDYKKCMCRLSIKNYIRNLLTKYGHPLLKKPQLSPHRHVEINYGAKAQYVNDTPASSPISPTLTKRVQQIVGSLLF